MFFFKNAPLIKTPKNFSGDNYICKNQTQTYNYANFLVEGCPDKVKFLAFSNY